MRATFGTSGPRITVRLFAGWAYPADICSDPEMVWKGYQGGVPMGGDIPPRPPGDTRPLLVWRQRATYDVFDKLGAYLGRVVLPKSARVIAAQGDRVWVVSKDSDDVESITVYRLMR